MVHNCTCAAQSLKSSRPNASAASTSSARSPQLDGVKRCNGADWEVTYNFVRPYGTLSGLTQSEYYVRRQAKETPGPSHMSSTQIVNCNVAHRPCLGRAKP